MKKLLYVTLFLNSSILIYAQESTLSDIGRIVLNSVVIDKENKLPEEAKSYLLTKLTIVAAENGMGGNSITPRFVIAAKINVLTKDIVAGPPQLIALNAELVFFIGDVEDNKIFTTTTIMVKGAGTNENKALLDAIQNINPKETSLTNFTINGKNKIAEYYSNQCDLIIKKVTALNDLQKYEAAIYELMQVPEICKACFDKCMDEVKPIYQKMIDRNCTIKLNNAKAKWNASPTGQGASDAGLILATIEPNAACYQEAVTLVETIRKKIEDNEKQIWDFEMKQFDNAIKLEQHRLQVAKEVAVEYLKNQPKTVIYDNIYWR